MQQQNPHHQHQSSTAGIRLGHNYHLSPTQQPPPTIVGDGEPGLVRPGSMTERARLAKIPPPETALKCPRCESTNTKFCYFNNYNLSQPRHFCKTCRRYWTKGGALRNVPVGGGCRRNNKRTKNNNRSKSPGPDHNCQTGSSSTSNTVTNSNSCNTNINIGGHLPQIPFLPHLQNFTDFASGNNIIGFNFGGVQSQVGQFSNTSDGRGGGSILTSGIAEQWRLQQQAQQFPFLANLEPHSTAGSTGLNYPFHEGSENNINETSSHINQQLRSSNKPVLKSEFTRLAGVKMEDNNNQGLNMSKNFLGALGNHQYWPGSTTGSNAWTDLSSAFTSSSTNHLL